jgi:mono/diheme cytochrome c family protein
LRACEEHDTSVRRASIRNASGHAILAGILILGLVGCGPRRERNPAGGEIYARYCASCHGATGHGDGPAASNLDPRPADLTRSTLELADLVRRIDGRHEVRAHGTSAMPAWGEVFDEQLVTEPKAREITRLRVQALAEHVRSLRATQ